MRQTPPELSPSWGLLGPEKLQSNRRIWTLELGPTNRFYDDLAVPGLGGLFFAKQLCLSLLGISVAAELRRSGKKVRNIETANAIEALACLFALRSNGGQGERRIKGSTKLDATPRGDLPTFDQARRPSYYVTQPFRMATAQPLRHLGLTSSAAERFNSYTLTDRGEALVETLCEEYGGLHYRRDLREVLIAWARGESLSLDGLLGPLSPIQKLPKRILEVITGYIVSNPRRRDALRWVQECVEDGHAPRLGKRPRSISEDHWQDLEAGALFFETQDAAIHLIETIEADLQSRERVELRLDETLPSSVKSVRSRLMACAERFLELERDPSPNQEASRFCRQCSRQSSQETLLSSLVLRDGRILRLGPDLNTIIPGPAYRDSAEDPTDESDSGGDVRQPRVEAGVLDTGHLSRRVRNLVLLQADLEGKLTPLLRTLE